MTRQQRARQNGFATIMVVWTLGFIAILALTAIVGARYRARDSSQIVSLTSLGLAADAGINLGIVKLLSSQSSPMTLHCLLPGGERLVLTMSDERGKVDLNTAPQPLLERLFTALSNDAALGNRIAIRIIEFRTPSKDAPDRKLVEAYIAAGKPEGPLQSPLSSIMELDQVVDVSPGLFRKALPFVTVSSGQPAIDPDLASPEMKRLLGITSTGPTTASQISSSGPSRFTISADVSRSDGARFVRNALVFVTNDPKEPIVIQEWRRGESEISKNNTATPPACLARLPA